MFLSNGLLLGVLGALTGVINAQFPPTPTGLTVLESHLEDGVRISYKQNDLCETTDGVRSFSGYIHLPAHALDNQGVQNQTYDINTFFWFFESRKDPANAPLSIWLNGGPGSSSMIGLLRGNGPCSIHTDSNSTFINDWSWNNEVNMLYLDQPVQAGFSYDVLTNITTDLDSGIVTVSNFSSSIPAQNNTFYVGTYPSQNPSSTTRGSENSARALWNFAQIWFQEFPKHKPNDNRVSISTESYGGKYGPIYMNYFQEQNERIMNGTWTEKGETHLLHLDTLVLVNTCIDRYVQVPSYPRMMYNNTYGIQAINESTYEQVLDDMYRKGGCLDQVETCRNLSLIYDPTNQAVNASVNTICAAAETFCSNQLLSPYFETSNYNYYDISAPSAASFPPPWMWGWVNQPHVQQGLGVPVNWTATSAASSQAFRSIGDYPRPGILDDLAYLLDSGIKISMIYGDRDFACNWYGGELVSLAIPYSGQASFASAGYTPLVVNTSYIGGQVRQSGNLSFTRVYESGHEVAAYQPETAYKIFTRALFNRDVATGLVDTACAPEYTTEGPADTYGILNEPIKDPGSQCYVLLPQQCTDEQWETVVDGTAVVRDWIVVDANTTALIGGLGGGNGTAYKWM